MSKIEAMRKALSAEAIDALSGLAGEYPGFVVERPLRACGERVMIELRKVGVVGDNDGLTVIGSGLAGRLRAERLDALFG